MQSSSKFISIVRVSILQVVERTDSRYSLFDCNMRHFTGSAVGEVPFGYVMSIVVASVNVGSHHRAFLAQSVKPKVRFDGARRKSATVVQQCHQRIP